MSSHPGRSRSSKTVLITGTSRGIGFATASLLAKEGWIVFAGVRKQSDFDKLQALHANTRPVILDVTKPEQVASAMDTVRMAVGESGLDALVNNAGGATFHPIEFFPPEEFEYGFQLNVIGVFRVTQAAIPLLRNGKPGRIINVSSFVGRAPAQLIAAYSSAKHAMEAFSSVLRQELKSSGISVSVLGAGAVKTDFIGAARANLEAACEKFKDNTDFKQRYEKLLWTGLETTEYYSQKTGLAAEDEACRIKHMLETSWLRHRYCDSWFTWLMTALYTWLPFWMTERLSAALYK